MNLEIAPTFDYTLVDSSKQARLQALAHQGRYHLRRTKEEIIAFGEVLIEAKSLLPHGSFRSWAAAEFEIPDSTLTYAMRKARGGDIELENVNINILPERAKSKAEDEEMVMDEYNPLARIFFLEIVARGQLYSEVKMEFMRRGIMHKWEAWCSQEIEMSPSMVGMYITVYEAFIMHPEKAPCELFPSLATPLVMLIGNRLSKYTEEDLKAVCLYADWLHGIALLQDGRPIDIPPEHREEALEEALEGLRMAKERTGCWLF